MGAKPFYRLILAASAEDAFRKTRRAEHKEYHDQICNFGGLSSKESFVIKAPPQGVALETWTKALFKGRLPATLGQHSEEFARHLSIYADKIGPALCFAASGTEAAFVEFVFVGCAEQ